jgi:hypothetical protein
MRKAMSAGAAVLALLFVEGVALAQAGGASGGGKYRVQPLNLHKETLGTEGFAAAARARMRNGDCAGALDPFDQALVSSVDPTLHRDRGLCHEKLGDTFPAIDDFRAYLTAAPDAADAENIRQRLARLEMDAYKHSSAPTEEDEKGATSGASVTASGSGSAQATVTVDGDGDRRRDRMETVEHDNDAMQSSLRAGKGLSLAPFFSEHKWLVQGTSFGDSTTWSEAVGLQLRWSVASQGAFVFEAGYEIFNATDVATVSGLTSQVGYELRIPFKPDYDDQFLLGVGAGYEYLVFSPKDPNATSASGGALVPRLRVGWRHMVASSVAIDLTLDGGVTAKALAQGNFLTSTDQPAEMLGVNLGVAWGL